MLNKRLKKFKQITKDDFYTHVRRDIIRLAERDKPITWSEYQGIRANSYERLLLHRNLDFDALLKLIKHFQNNSRRALWEYELPTDYDDALQRELLPLLLQKIEKQLGEGEVITDCELVDCEHLRSIGRVHIIKDVCAKGYKVSIGSCYKQREKDVKRTEKVLNSVKELIDNYTTHIISELEEEDDVKLPNWCGVEDIVRVNLLRLLKDVEKIHMEDLKETIAKETEDVGMEQS